MADVLNDSRRTNGTGGTTCRDQGSSLVIAVLVSVVVFLLGAAWVAMASHESSASNNDRTRQQAVDAAMAGLVLANSALTTNASYSASGLVAFSGGSAELSVTVVTDPPGSLRRIITSVGYAPSSAAPTKSTRTVRQVVDLVAVGFTYGLFFDGPFTTGSTTTAIGDMYASGDIYTGNSSNIVGNISTPGSISTGSNQAITGTLRANGSISVTSSSTTIYGSAVAGTTIATGGTIRDTAQAGGTIGPSPSCNKVLGACLPGSPPPAVPPQHLPTFTWNPSNYSPAPIEYAAGAAFVNAVSKVNAQGVFHIQGDAVFKNNDELRLTGDMTIVATGAITLPGTVTNNTAGGAAVQLTVISSGGGDITPSNNFTIPNTVRTLFYTTGNFVAKNSSTFTGALYVGGITGGSGLAVTDAPVSAPGFDWTRANAQSFTILNVSTREIVNGT